MSATAVRHPVADATAELRERVRALAAEGTPARIVGRGTWLDAGRPVHARATLAVQDAGIVDYVPGDLTLTARAGTPIAELQAATRAHGQWVPLDPWGGDAGTLGATLATATAGPLASSVGLPRDVVLGLELVTGDARVVRGGGRVVKNVAGFDLVRLAVGAWGTLGAITEATVRLRALPEADETVVLPAARPLDELATALRALQPAAAELLGPSLARRLNVADGTALLVRVAGNAALVADRRRRLAELGDVAPVDAGVWDALRTVEPAGSAAVVRWSHLPARLADAWRRAAHVTAALPDALAHASVLRGVVRLVVPAADPAVLHELLAPPFDGTTIHERLPAELWPRLAPSPVRDRLSLGVRAAFDPHRLLNRGILGEDA